MTFIYAVLPRDDGLEIGPIQSGLFRFDTPT
jgi:hypothetical protein